MFRETRQVPQEREKIKEQNDVLWWGIGSEIEKIDEIHDLSEDSAFTKNVDNFWTRCQIEARKKAHESLDWGPSVGALSLSRKSHFDELSEKFRFELSKIWPSFN